MPHMSGTQFLLEAIKLYPDARRVLLTAYADTDTAITAINQIGLDHYLLKPWEPPTVRLYPILEDLLSDWFARARPAFDGHPGGRHRALTRELRGEGLPGVATRCPTSGSTWRSDADRRASCPSVPAGRRPSPDGVLPRRHHAGAAHHRAQLAEKIGLQTRAQKPFYDLIVVGGGPAGLAGAVYGASEGLRTILVERAPPAVRRGRARTSRTISGSRAASPAPISRAAR